MGKREEKKAAKAAARAAKRQAKSEKAGNHEQNSVAIAAGVIFLILSIISFWARGWGSGTVLLIMACFPFCMGGGGASPFIYIAACFVAMGVSTMYARAARIAICEVSGECEHQDTGQSIADTAVYCTAAVLAGLSIVLWAVAAFKEFARRQRSPTHTETPPGVVPDHPTTDYAATSAPPPAAGPPPPFPPVVVRPPGGGQPTVLQPAGYALVAGNTAYVVQTPPEGSGQPFMNPYPIAGYPGGAVPAPAPPGAQYPPQQQYPQYPPQQQYQQQQYPPPQQQYPPPQQQYPPPQQQQYPPYRPPPAV